MRRVSPMAWIIALGIGLRIAAALYLGSAVTPLPGAFDQIWYDQLAMRVAEGHGFSFGSDAWPNTPADTPTAFWSFLYTGLVAVFYGTVGHRPLVVRLLQAVVVGALLPLGTWQLARATVGERAAVIAGLLAAVYAYFVYYSAMLMTEMFTITTVIWLLVSAVGLAQAPSWRRWLGFGIIVGVAGLLRQVVLLPVPFLCLWIVWRRRPVVASDAAQHRVVADAWQPFRSALLGVALAAGAALVVMAPVTLRNASVFHRFVLANTNAGYAFFWANHPIHGTRFKDILGPDDPSYQDLIPHELRHLDEAALNEALMARGWQFVVDDPVRYLQLSLSRIPDYVRFWPSPDSSRLSNVARVLSFGIMWPFMVAGMWLARRDWRRTMPLLLFAGSYTIIHLMSWALVRYRLPVDAVLLVFAAVALERMVDLLRGSDRHVAAREVG